MKAFDPFANDAKPWEILRAAVWDCVAVEAGEVERKGVTVTLRMEWFGTVNPTNCGVCVAGALLLRRARSEFDQSLRTAESLGYGYLGGECVDFDMLPQRHMRVAFMLDSMRTCELDTAYRELERFNVPDAGEWCESLWGIADMYRQRLGDAAEQLPWPEYLAMADELEALGLPS